MTCLPPQYKIIIAQQLLSPLPLPTPPLPALTAGAARGGRVEASRIGLKGTVHCKIESYRRDVDCGHERTLAVRRRNSQRVGRWANDLDRVGSLDGGCWVN